jgi:hypothetical protein
MRRLLHWFVLPLAVVLALGAGCGRSTVDQALESDAHGYSCSKCQTKFWTSRDVFADVCPQCKSFDIAEVIGFVCASDSQMTIAPRGRGSVVCSRCGKPATGLALPREKDLIAWGALRKTKADVSAKP